MFSAKDFVYMRHAIQLAETAATHDEVPVGAVLVHEDQIIGEGFNRSIMLHDPSAHAEMLALRAGGERVKNYRLVNSTLYITLEPCIMCVGAIVHARIKRVLYGAPDPKTGAVNSLFQLGTTNPLNHQVQYQGGLLQKECGDLLKDFFRARR